MIHEVRVYDANGKLKDRFTPVFDYEVKPIGSQAKICKKQCPECKRTTRLKGNQRFCTVACRKANKARLNKQKGEKREATKPKVVCELCDNAVTGRRVKYCSWECGRKARKIKAVQKQIEITAQLKIRREELENEEHRQAI